MRQPDNSVTVQDHTVAVYAKLFKSGMIISDFWAKQTWKWTNSSDWLHLCVLRFVPKNEMREKNLGWSHGWWDGISAAYILRFIVGLTQGKCKLQANVQVEGRVKLGPVRNGLTFICRYPFSDLPSSWTCHSILKWLCSGQHLVGDIAVPFTLPDFPRLFLKHYRSASYRLSNAWYLRSDSKSD